MIRLMFPLLSILALASVAAASDVRGVTLAHVHRSGAGYGSADCAEQLKAVVDLGANWVALNDFGYMRSVSDPAVSFRRDSTMGRRCRRTSFLTNRIFSFSGSFIRRKMPGTIRAPTSSWL